MYETPTAVELSYLVVAPRPHRLRSEPHAPLIRIRVARPEVDRAEWPCHAAARSRRSSDHYPCGEFSLTLTTRGMTVRSAPLLPGLLSRLDKPERR
jgi:hypothetical protein